MNNDDNKWKKWNEFAKIHLFTECFQNLKIADDYTQLTKTNTEQSKISSI